MHPDGTVHDRYVLVRDGRIVSVSRRRPALSTDVPYVETERRDWISSGLINLHAHVDYNLLPLWHTALAPFNNRFEWRSDADYKRDVKDLSFQVPRQGERDRGGGLRRAAGGGRRDLGVAGDVARSNARPAASTWCFAGTPARRKTSASTKTRPFCRSSTGSGRAIQAERPSRRQGRSRTMCACVTSGKLAAAIVHLAEGRCGYGTDLGVDPYCRREFEVFMAHPAFQDAGAVRACPLTLVHCSGIDVRETRAISAFCAIATSRSSGRRCPICCSTATRSTSRRC